MNLKNSFPSSSCINLSIPISYLYINIYYHNHNYFYICCKSYSMLSTFIRSFRTPYFCYAFGRIKLQNLNKIKPPSIEKTSNQNEQENEQPTTTMSKQSLKQQQEINWKIKRIVKMKQVFSVFKKNRLKMSISQHLSLMSKLSYIIEADKDEIIANEDDIKKFVMFLGKQIMKEQVTPENYINFLHILSKIKNLQFFRQFFPVASKVISELKDNPFEIVSVEQNTKLLFSLLKISNFVGRQSSKEIIAVIRGMIVNIHHDKVLSKIPTRILIQLMEQYIAAYPSLVLTMHSIKQITREASRRKPNIWACFTIEKLILKSINTETLKRQILSTKSQSMRYNIVHRANKNISKKFLYEILVQNKSQDLPLDIMSHFRFLSKVGMQGLDKLELVKEYHRQIAISFEYLKQIYTNKIQKNTIQVLTTLELFAFLLTDEIFDKIPSDSINGVKNVINELYSKFMDIQVKEVQILLVQLSLRKKYSNSQEVLEKLLQLLQNGMKIFHKKKSVPVYLSLLKYKAFASSYKSLSLTRKILKKYMFYIEQFKSSQIQKLREFQNKELLFEAYKEASNFNKSIPSHIEEQQIKEFQKPNFRVRNYEDDEECLSQYYEVRMLFRKKIKNCLMRAYLMVQIMEQQDLPRIKEVFEEEWKHFQFHQIYSYVDIEMIFALYKKMGIEPQLKEEIELLNSYRLKMENQRK